MMNTNRKMASIQQVEQIENIPNAENIQLATLRGWHAVIKKGQFKPGDHVIFCEPDSLLPPKPEFEFMKDKKYRIKTIRLRGVISQGICFPLDILPEGSYNIEDDVSEILGITKYEAPVPTQLRGRMRGPMSRLAVPKTDEMRVQNILGVLKRHKGEIFYISEKIDGTSMSCYLDPETGMHVCSRNVDLAPDFEHKWNGDSYWRYATEHNMEEILKQLGGTIALQGELFGEGIQGSKYKIKGIHYRVFNFWDMINHKYIEREVMVDTVETFGLGKDFLVPALGKITLNHAVDDLLKMAEGKSVISDVLREGLVFRPEVEGFDFEIGRLSFKAVSPEFLIKHGE